MNPFGHADRARRAAWPRREDLEDLVRTTPTGAGLAIVVTLIVLGATWPVVGGPVLGVWATYTLGLHGWMVYRALSGSGHVARVGPGVLRKLRLFAVLMAAPWAALALLAFGPWSVHVAIRELAVFAAVGMAAGGAFMLHRVLASAILYVGLVLGAIIAAAVVSTPPSGWAIAGLALIYGLFLARFSLDFAALARERLDNLENLEHANRRIRILAYTDPVTGLSNRKAFQDRLDSETGSRGSKTLGLLLLDLDQFKNINDTLGHHYGDWLLAAVAGRLKSALRPGDMVARLGGDEFAILVEDGEETLTPLGKRLIERLSQPFTMDGVEMRTATSIGAALCPRDTTEPQNLLTLADIALRRAKEAGGEEIRFYRDALGDADDEAGRIAERLRTALAAGPLALRYQPKIRLADQSLAGAEAMPHWDDPDLAALPPARLLEIAAARGLIRPLTQAVFAAAVRDLQAWHAAGVTVGPVGINLHPLDLKAPDALKGHLQDAHSQGIANGELVLEITADSLNGRGSGAARQLMTTLAQDGIALSLDAFGNGQAALAHLRTLPFTEIKIDPSVVDGMTGSPQDRAIVSGLLTMARGIERRVVAQGVARDDQLALLDELGADLAQGPCLSPLLTPEALARRARTNA